MIKVATIIELFQKWKKERNLFTLQLIILKCWTMYVWLSSNENSSIRINCSNFKILCVQNTYIEMKKIKKELWHIRLLESLNFSINFTSCYKIHFLTCAYTINKRMNEWIHVYAKVFALVRSCMRVTPCFSLSLSLTRYYHYRNSCTNMNIYIKFPWSSMSFSSFKQFNYYLNYTYKLCAWIEYQME